MQPLLPLTDDELAMVTGSQSIEPLTNLVEEVREWLTQGHRTPGMTR